MWVTPQKLQERYDSTSSHNGRLDSETNELDEPNLSSPSVARSSQDGGRRPRVAKRLLRSDSNQGRENGLPDYVTFVPDTPTTNSNSSPFFYSNTYSTATYTCTTSTSSNSGGISSNLSTASISKTGDSSSTLSRNFDIVSSDPGTDDPKRYVRRLLKQYYHLGNITSYQFSRILERASRRVERHGLSLSTGGDEQRIRKVVDAYVEAYINAAANPE